MGLLDSFKKKTNKSEAFGKINSGNFTMTRQTSNIQFTEDEIDKVFQTLTSADIALKNSFEDYLKEEYKGDDAARLDYFDIAEIGRQIVAKLKRGQTEDFQLFFDKVEDFISSITPHADVINNDITNFTKTTPISQISEVVL